MSRSLLILAITLTLPAGAEPLEAAIREIDPDLTPDHYAVKRVDLDDDGREDALVLTEVRSGATKAEGGTLLILHSGKDAFRKVGVVRKAHPPVYLRKTGHHGWRDLLVGIRGENATPSFAALAHDGEGYQLAPGDEAVVPTPADHVLVEEPTPSDGHEDHQAPPPDGRPAQLEPAELAEFDALPEIRKKVVAEALRIGREFHLDQYVFGSADPKQGGFDCSGCLYYVLGQCGLKPPRTSATQFDWIKESGGLVKIEPGVTSLDDRVFAALQPGDLLFWSGTYAPADGRTNHITHVQMYLGTEKKDGRQVMIGSSDGRSYRGKRQCGYGVFDFRLPRKGSSAHFAGYGPPPGIDPE